MKRSLGLAGLAALVLVGLRLGIRALAAHNQAAAQRELQQRVLGGYATGPGQPVPMYGWLLVAAGFVIVMAGGGLWFYKCRR